MRIASITPARYAEFLTLVNAEIRPDRANSTAEQDFPLILNPENSEWTLVATAPDGELIGGLACLIRDVETSCGVIPVAGIGSVVTRPKFRGQGHSSALQNAMLAQLKGKNVPLAVLWTDRPEIYAGRGFVSAGWELHIDLASAELESCLPPGFVSRAFEAADVTAVERLYNRHPLRTVRHPGDAALLYNMPGTRGLVATGEGGEVLAAVFCGKGADFPDYVAEWSGPVALVRGLLAEVRDRGWARHVLVPAGHEGIVASLVECGAGASFCPGGYWAVLQPERLGRYLQAAGVGGPPTVADPQQLLGYVDPEGQPVGGLLTIGVWGLDSV